MQPRNFNNFNNSKFCWRMIFNSLNLSFLKRIYSFEKQGWWGCACGKYLLKTEGMALMGDTLNKKKNKFDLKKQWISELLEKTLKDLAFA